MGTYGGHDIRADGDRAEVSYLIRKAGEAGSGLYRLLIWPWIKMYKELTTHSTLRQGAYLIRTDLEGHNYIGKDAFLKNSLLGYGSYIQSGCDITDTDIGKYSSIGSGVKTVIGSHPTDKAVALHPAFNLTKDITGLSYNTTDNDPGELPARTRIGSDVWLGNDVRIMGGVSIGDGAIVGAGAIVTRDIPPYSINAGVPAKIIRYRFTGEQREKLLAIRWWEKDETWIRAHIDDFSDVEEFLKK